MPATKDGKVAVILSGGGANGGYEIGVMKALFSGACPLTGHRPLAADIFTGTSVGSYNAAFMVSQSELEGPSVVARLEDIWINRVAHSRGTPNGVFRFRGPLSLLDVQSLAAHPLKPFEELAEDSAFFAKDWFRRGVNFFRSSGNLERRTLELVDLSALISTEPLKQLVKETIELSKIRQSDKNTEGCRDHGSRGAAVRPCGTPRGSVVACLMAARVSITSPGKHVNNPP